MIRVRGAESNWIQIVTNMRGEQDKRDASNQRKHAIRKGLHRNASRTWKTARLRPKFRRDPIS